MPPLLVSRPINVLDLSHLQLRLYSQERRFALRPCTNKRSLRPLCTHEASNRVLLGVCVRRSTDRPVQGPTRDASGVIPAQQQNPGEATEGSGCSVCVRADNDNDLRLGFISSHLCVSVFLSLPACLLLNLFLSLRLHLCILCRPPSTILAALALAASLSLCPQTPPFLHLDHFWSLSFCFLPHFSFFHCFIA